MNRADACEVLYEQIELMAKGKRGRPLRRARVKAGYIHPLARDHKKGEAWPERTIARVTNFAIFNGVAAAGRKYVGISPLTIAAWVVNAAKPCPVRDASRKMRLHRIKNTCETLIYQQARKLLRKLDRIPDVDKPEMMERLAKCLAQLGATAQKLEIADTTADVVEQRRRSDAALEAFEADQPQKGRKVTKRRKSK